MSSGKKFSSGVFGWRLRTVPTNSKVFLHGLLNMWEKQILTSAIEIQKENWGVTMHFLKIINQQYLEKAFKYKAMYGVLFQIEA